jgi:hypothetical protein
MVAQGGRIPSDRLTIAPRLPVALLWRHRLPPYLTTADELVVVMSDGTRETGPAPRRSDPEASIAPASTNYLTSRADSSRCALNFLTPSTILPMPYSKKNAEPTMIG